MSTRKYDHFVIAVKDLEKTAGFFESLGFTLTQKSMHPFGTGNRLIVLKNAYIEFLSVFEPDKIPAGTPDSFSFAEYNNMFLEKREGISMAVLTSDNAEAEQKRLMENHIDTYPLLSFSRKAIVQSGDEVEYAFSTVFPEAPSFSEARLFYCEHRHKPEDFYRPEYLTHLNGADIPVKCTLIAPNPGDIAGVVEKILGTAPKQFTGETIGFELENGGYDILSPRMFEESFGSPDHVGYSERPVYGALNMGIKNMDVLLHRLDEIVIPYIEDNGIVTISPENAFGFYLRFKSSYP